jgi:2,4-diketo-3-deoxy-L-fuconate hydrolase
MKLVTFSHNQRNRVGILDGDMVYRISFDMNMFELLQRGVMPTKTSERYPLSEVKFQAPFIPNKMIAVGRNYAEHAAELGNDVPKQPLLFAKLNNTVIGEGDTITWNASATRQVDWEVELAVIIGKRARNVSEADALKHVFGYTVANDVSARDLQDTEGQWLRAKSMDTFCPLGSIIVTRDEIPDPQNLALRTMVNGEVMQDSNTSNMIFSVAYLISHISHIVTLQAGDVILTGTPSGVGKGMKPPRFLGDGDRVTVEIDGICSLTNPCRVME